MSEIKEAVREKYAGIARAARAGAPEGCCSSAAGGCGCGGDYAPEEIAGLPLQMLQTSLGCGNPVAPAELRPGETVLDLGSGAGLDVLLAARRVGPEGKVYGLDMTDEMLALARENRRKSGIENAAFIKGEMESIPLPDDSVDVVISNCVINLAADKARVLAEACRVLKPGGRLAVSDMVWRKEVPEWLRRHAELWAGCVAGALTEAEYREALARAGFLNVELETTRAYGLEDMPAAALTEEMRRELAPYGGALVSALVRARKPALTAAIAEDREQAFALLQEAGLTTIGIPADLAGFFVARAPHVIGVVGLEYYGPFALLRSLAVAPPERGRGLGRRLVARALESARERGAREVYLLTVTAREYLARLGFTEVRREDVPAAVRESREFREICPASAVVMRKPI